MFSWSRMLTTLCLSAVLPPPSLYDYNFNSISKHGQFVQFPGFNVIVLIVIQSNLLPTTHRINWNHCVHEEIKSCLLLNRHWIKVTDIYDKFIWQIYGLFTLLTDLKEVECKICRMYFYLISAFIDIDHHKYIPARLSQQVFTQMFTEKNIILPIIAITLLLCMYGCVCLTSGNTVIFTPRHHVNVPITSHTQMQSI